MSNSRFILLFLLVLVLASATGCAAVAGIFKAGLWVGIALSVLVIGGGLFLVMRMRG